MPIYYFLLLKTKLSYTFIHQDNYQLSHESRKILKSKLKINFISDIERENP
jgi:hypothetical protein